MSKTKSTRGSRTTAKSKEPVQNAVADLGMAVGMPSAGFPYNQGSPYTQPISNTPPLFNNLRWYLVSNFWQLLSQMYVEFGLVQNLIDVPVDDGMRGGVKITSKQLDEDQIIQLQSMIERQDDLGKVAQAMKWTRLYGGGGIVIATNQDPLSPMKMDAISADSPLEFIPADMWELNYDKQNIEGYDPAVKINPAGVMESEEEEEDYYSYYGTSVHKTRVIKLMGLQAPAFIRPRLRGWGYSVVEKLVRSLNSYLKTVDLTYEVLDEFKLDVYKMKNLANTLLSPNGMEKVRRRMQVANYMKNYQNGIAMDSEDDFDHKQLSFTGLAEVMRENRVEVASNMRMPLTKIFGLSAAGFNSGEDDIEVYNSMVESDVRGKTKYPIIRIIEFRCQQLFGMVPDDLEIEFEPLRYLSAEQQENVKTQKFNRLLQAKTAGEITRFEFREACNKGNLLDITLDTSADKLNPEDPDVATLVAGEPELDPNESGADEDAEENDTIPNAKRVKNTAEFDRRAYSVDGGDAQFFDRREPLYSDSTRFIDKSLYEKAKEASVAAFGKMKWKFTLWWYLNKGGKIK